MDTAKYVEETASAINDFCISQGLDNRGRSAFMRMLFDAVSALPGPDNSESLSYISAPNAVVEVIDWESGVLFRRYLELDYDENDNGIRLRGEDMTGREISIVYLSGAAIEKMNDLQGHGIDKPRCEDKADPS